MNTKVTIDVGVNAHSDGLEDIKRQAGDVEAAQKRMAESASDAGQQVSDAWQQAADTFRDLKNLLPEVTKNLEALGTAQSASMQAVLKQMQELQSTHSSSLSDLLKQSGQQNAQSASLLPEILKQLQTLQSQSGKNASKNPLQDNSPEGLLQRVQGNLITTEAYINAAMKPSDFVQIQKRISIAQSLLGQASQGGADQQKVQDLTTKINELTKALQDTKDAYKNSNPTPNPGSSGGGSGGFGGSAGPPPPEGGGVDAGQMAMNVLGLFRNGGMLGMLGRLGVPGMLVGGTIGAVNYIDRTIQRSNNLARSTVQADADLARQYGITSDPLTMFRGTDLLTRPELASLGYTAADAGRIAAMYNLPGGMRGDVTNILKFARVNAMDEGLVAQAGRTLGVTGIAERGNNLQALQTLSQAMADGLKEGVAGSDTFRQLVNYAEAQLKQGVTSNQQSLQYMAGLQQALASTGNRALQGEAGAKTMDSLMGGITGKNDYASQAYLFQSTGGFSAKELGLTGVEARGYEALQKSSPMQAFTQALGLIRAGRGSGTTKTKLASAMYDASGGNPAILSAMLSDWGIEGDAQLQFLGQKGSFVSTFTESQSQAGRYSKAGEMLDPQGKNRVAWNSIYKDKLEQETQWLNSTSSLVVTGSLEERLAKFRFKMAETISKALGGKTLLQPGSLEGTPGANSENLVVKSGQQNTQFPLDKTLYAIAQVESSGGYDPNMNKGDGARGAYQLFGQNIVGWDPKNPNPAGDYDKKYLGREAVGPDGKPITSPAAAREWITNNPEAVQKIVQGFITEKSRQVRAQYKKAGIDFADKGGEKFLNAVVAAAVGVLWHNGEKWDGITDKDGNILPPDKWNTNPRADGVSDAEYGNRMFQAYMSGSVGAPVSPKPGKKTTPAPPKKLTPEQQQNVDYNDVLNRLNVTNITMEAGQKYSTALRNQYPNLPETHQGVDFTIGGSGPGDEIRNIFEGAKVTGASKGFNDGYGNMVTLKLKNGLEARLAHLQEIKVKAGQILKMDDLIGLEGSTGNSTNPHLHMELRKDGKAITDQDEWWKAFLDSTKPKKPKTSSTGSGSTAMLLPDLLPPTTNTPEQRIVVEVRGLDNINVSGTNNTSTAQTVRSAVSALVQAVLPPPTGHVGT